MKTVRQGDNICGLQRLDNYVIPDSATEIRLFAKVRNEAKRLPYFLAYYRRLGVDRFFIIDNSSDDDTTEILKANNDCHVFFTDRSMAGSRAGLNWIEPLLRKYGLNRWCLIVDADELFVYPNSEYEALPLFCRRLDLADKNAASCIMIDMYPEGDVETIEYREGQSFIDACPFFDKSGYRFLASDTDVPTIIGGPRLRLFFPELLDWGLAARTRRGFHDYICRVIGKLPIFRATSLWEMLKPKVPPHLNKVPLVRWTPNILLTPAAHSISNARVSEASAALLHFKFLGDFNQRVSEETVRKAYRGDEYARYISRVGQSTSINFTCDLTVRFTGTHQLLELGLIRNIDAMSEAT
jgi:hypothetical protein